MRGDNERLADIEEAIIRIQRYQGITFAEFESNELLQVWVLHHLQIVGDAIRGLSPEFRSSHPEVPWTDIIGMRNVIVHSYFGINTRVVWRAIVSDLPSLSVQIKAIITERGLDADE
ncbi:MAG TPA: DUF86 domain-containing protein [Thermomicrobiaceae bacterium]|nr:DUF86 domain-containing protein [Thermomicrobiaceae bacterium]